MQLIIDERAEKALRYLAPDEAKRARSALKALEHQDPKKNRQRYRKLASPPGGQQLFLLRVTPRLRAIFRYSDDDKAVIVEDLVARAALTRTLRRVER